MYAVCKFMLQTNYKPTDKFQVSFPQSVIILAGGTFTVRISQCTTQRHKSNNHCVRAVFCILTIVYVYRLYTVRRLTVTSKLPYCTSRGAALTFQEVYGYLYARNASGGYFGAVSR